MPPSLFCEEFYWRAGRLVSETVRRRTVRSRWPRLHYDELVVAFENLGKKRKITYGPQGNPIRIARAFSRYRNLECDPHAPDIGPSVPEPLLDQVSQACKAAVQKLVL